MVRSIAHHAVALLHPTKKTQVPRLPSSQPLLIFSSRAPHRSISTFSRYERRDRLYRQRDGVSSSGFLSVKITPLGRQRWPQTTISSVYRKSTTLSIKYEYVPCCDRIFTQQHHRCATARCTHLSTQIRGTSECFGPNTEHGRNTRMHVHLCCKRGSCRHTRLR